MRHKILYYVSITVLFALLGVVAPVPTAASPEGPRDVMVYEEDFTAYTYKDYTENAEWDIWTRSLHLALVDRIVQTNPIIVALGDGRFVVTWEDYRNSQWDIYAQRTDANGNRLWSQDVRILTDVGTFAQCSLAPDGEDGFFVAWRNAHTGDGDIFTQHLDRSGNRLWTADVRTNTDPGTAGQWRPTVSPDGSGGVFVAWGDGRNGDSDIYAQHLDGNGNRLWTADVRVNTDTGTAVQGAPGLTSCADDTICAVWQDTRNGDADVYAQRLDASGNALWTADVRVNSDSGTAAQSSPALAPDGIGGIFVAWRDMRNDSYTADIYAQRVGPVGSRLWAADVLVDSNANTGQLSDPSLVPDGSGGVFVAWGEGENGDAYAYAQRLDEVGNRVWNQDVQVGISNEGYPTVASVGTGGDFIVAWPHEAADIHTQRLNSAGNPVWSREVQVNIGTGAAAQRSPAVTPDGDGGAILLWMNSRTGTSYGVRAQRFDQNGTTAWLQSVPLIDDTGSGPFARELDIAGTGDKVVAVWGGVSAQMIDRSGNRQWPDAASVRSSAEWGHSPEVAMLSDGSALVVWMDHRNTSDLPTSPHPFDVYAQRMSPTGDRLWAQDVQVNSVVGSGNQYLYTIDVAANQANTVTVVWPDSQEGQHIMAQRIGIDGTAQWGGGRRVNIQSGFSWSPTVAVDSSGRSYVAWPEEDNYTVEIYLQALDTAGNPTWGSDVLVAEGCVPQVTVDSEDKAIVVWASEESVYAQRFDADGSRLWDNDVLISDTGIDYWCARDGGLAATSDDLGSFFVAWGNDRNVTDDVFLKKFNLAGQAQWVEEAKAVSLDFFYSTPGSVQSHTLDTLSDDIRQATLIAEDQPWGGSVTFYLTNDGGAHWAAVTPGVTHVFTTAGSDLRWRAVLTADPLWPRTPIVRSLRIEYSTQMSYADDYEGDDTCARARPIQVNGAAQTHTFHQAGDADWAWFDVISGTTYIVETYNLGTRAQTVVEPHRTCQAPPAGTGRSFGNGYTFSFTADQTSRYYAKVYNHTPSVYGQDTDYTLSVRSIHPNAVAIVVAGHDDAHSYQDNILYAADRAYRVFLNAGLGKANVRYLAPLPDHDADGDGANDVAALSTPANVRDTVQDWARGRGVELGVPLYVYLVDHGLVDRFKADGDALASHVTAADLNLWLSNLEATTGTDNVNVLLDACYSGSFIDVTALGPASISGRNRVVIASTTSDWQAYGPPGGEGLYFSNAFFSGLENEQSLWASYAGARQAVESQGLLQQPWLDDNGDQRADSLDGTLASGRALRRVAMGGGAPLIEWLSASEGVIRAKVVDDSAWVGVKVEVFAPSYVPPEPDGSGTTRIVDVPVVTLADLDSDGVYEGTYAFADRGVYRLVAHAEDAEGNLALPQGVQVCVGCVYLPMALRNT